MPRETYLTIGGGAQGAGAAQGSPEGASGGDDLVDQCGNASLSIAAQGDGASGSCGAAVSPGAAHGGSPVESLQDFPIAGVDVAWKVESAQRGFEREGVKRVRDGAGRRASSLCLSDPDGGLEATARCCAQQIEEALHRRCRARSRAQWRPVADT